MSVFQEKLELFCKYCEEMGQVGGQAAVPATEAKNAAIAYIDSEYAKWENIWAKDGVLAGFLVILKNHRNHSDYAIAHLYVLPEYRRQGYAKKTVLRFLSGHPGKYCMAAPDTDGAHALWGSIKKRGNIKPMPAVKGEVWFSVKGEKHES